MACPRIGTCSWKFSSWKGLVYSRGNGINYLTEYARSYETVEVDQWFWSLFGLDGVVLPKAGAVEEYNLSVPQDFRFSVKVPNSITLTHFYRKKKAEPLIANPHFLSVSLFEEFLVRLSALRSKLGPLILQFEYLNRRKMSSPETFLQALGDFRQKLPGGWDYAVEVRNPQYLSRTYFEFLKEYQIAPVLIDGYWMPPVTEVYRKYRRHLMAHRLMVVRLLGPDREQIERATGKQWHTRVAPRDDILRVVVGMLDELCGQGIDVYLNVNNHFEGSAPLTIKRIRELLAAGSAGRCSMLDGISKGD